MYSYVPYNQLLRAQQGSDKGPGYPGKPARAKPGPPANKATTETDGPPPRSTPSQFNGNAQFSIKTLDRSLKSFLRTSNLSGLDYRLKIAGYNTFNDLLEADAHTLVKKGFTGLMARRLVSAVEEHLRREGRMLQPYQVVRQGAKIREEPSEEVKALPTFGKRNVKRKVSSEDQREPKRVHAVHLMSEEALQSSQVIFPHVIQIEKAPGEEQSLSDRTATTEQAATEEAPTSSEGPTAAEDVATTAANHDQSIPSTSPAADTSAKEATASWSQLSSEEERGGVAPRRWASVPADFHWLGQTELYPLQTRARAYTV